MCFLQLASKTSSALSELFPHVAAILPERAVGTASVIICHLDIESPLEWFHVCSLWLIISIIIIYRRFPTYQRITFKLPQQYYVSKLNSHAQNIGNMGRLSRILYADIMQAKEVAQPDSQLGRSNKTPATSVEWDVQLVCSPMSVTDCSAFTWELH
jgi:hypothetical protein